MADERYILGPLQLVPETDVPPAIYLQKVGMLFFPP